MVEEICQRWRPGAAFCVGASDQVLCGHQVKSVKAFGGRHVHPHHVVLPENEAGVVSCREALAPQHHIETVRAPCEESSVVEGGSPFADLACSTHVEDADAAAFSPEAIEAFRHAYQRGVVSPYTTIDQTVRIHPMGGEEGRCCRGGQRDVRRPALASRVGDLDGAGCGRGGRDQRPGRSLEWRAALASPRESDRQSSPATPSAGR